MVPGHPVNTDAARRTYTYVRFSVPLTRVYAREAKQYTRCVCGGWFAGFGKLRTQRPCTMSERGGRGGSMVENSETWRGARRARGSKGREAVIAVIELLIKPVN